MELFLAPTYFLSQKQFLVNNGSKVFLKLKQLFGAKTIVDRKNFLVQRYFWLSNFWGAKNLFGSLKE